MAVAPRVASKSLPTTSCCGRAHFVAGLLTFSLLVSPMRAHFRMLPMFSYDTRNVALWARSLLHFSFFVLSGTYKKSGRNKRQNVFFIAFENALLWSQ